jgi:ParB family chromosome partitioning protein
LSDDPATQKRIARAIIEKQMSVREAERAMKSAIASGAAAGGAKRSIITKDANIRSAETKLMRALGTNVKITPNGKGTAGKIEIEYYNLDDLDRLYQKLVNTKEG